MRKGAKTSTIGVSTIANKASFWTFMKVATITNRISTVTDSWSKGRIEVVIAIEYNMTMFVAKITIEAIVFVVLAAVTTTTIEPATTTTLKAKVSRIIVTIRGILKERGGVGDEVG